MDIDIYDDLDDFHEEEQKKSKELLEWEAKYNDAMQKIEDLRQENKELTKTVKRIELNFQSLLDTAKAEINRKDQQIAAIRKEKDDICFRRRQNHQWRGEHQPPKAIINSSRQPEIEDVSISTHPPTDVSIEKFDLKRADITHSVKRTHVETFNAKQSRQDRSVSQKREERTHSSSRSNRSSETEKHLDKDYSRRRDNHSTLHEKHTTHKRHDEQDRRRSRRESSSDRRDRNSRDKCKESDSAKKSKTSDRKDERHVKKINERHETKPNEKKEVHKTRNANKQSEDDDSSGRSAREHNERNVTSSDKVLPTEHDCAKRGLIEEKRKKNNVEQNNTKVCAIDDTKSNNSAQTQVTDSGHIDSCAKFEGSDHESKFKKHNGIITSTERSVDKATDENCNIPNLNTPKKVALFNTLFGSGSSSSANSCCNTVVLTNVMNLLCNSNTQSPTSVTSIEESGEHPPKEHNKKNQKNNGDEDFVKIESQPVTASQPQSIGSLPCSDDVIEVYDSDGSKASQLVSENGTVESERIVTDPLKFLEVVLSDGDDASCSGGGDWAARRERIQILEDIRLPTVFDVAPHGSNSTETSRLISEHKSLNGLSPGAENMHRECTAKDKLPELIEISGNHMEATVALEDAAPLTKNESGETEDHSALKTFHSDSLPTPTKQKFHLKLNVSKKRKLSEEINRSPSSVEEHASKMPKLYADQVSNSTVVKHFNRIESSDDDAQQQLTPTEIVHNGVQRRRHGRSRMLRIRESSSDDDNLHTLHATSKAANEDGAPAQLSMANVSIDEKFNEIDSRMQSMFASPPAKCASQVVPQQSSPQHDNSTMNLMPFYDSTQVTINETCNISTSSQHAEQSTEIKCISLGSSDYRLEKVSPNVVNVFITRRHAKRKVPKEKLVQTAASASKSTTTATTPT